MKEFIRKYFDIYPRVFFSSLILILAFVIVAISGGDEVLIFFEKAAVFITAKTGWLFIFGVNLFVIVSLWVAFGKYGKIRLGGENAKADFTGFSWFAMLLSAGMGIGLLYFSVSEPITHFANPPLPTLNISDKAIQALNITYLHYGLHAWGIYCMVGLALAYFSFNKNLPFSLRSVFFPLLGRKIFGLRGDIIDIISVVATMFGLATSLGFGAKQIASGLQYLFGISNGIETQISIISSITFIATISVVTGIRRGVRFLSRLNIYVAAIFMLSIFLLSDSIALLNLIIESVGNYVYQLSRLSTWTSSFTDSTWQVDWTIFYWAWWISWSPFVGSFIARVSRGRTIKEFVLVVLLVPTLTIFLWITVFGGSALMLEIEFPGLLSLPILKDNSASLFVFLQQFPMSALTTVVGLLMVSIFFVTSSDSGSLVIDSITSGGKLNAPVGQRIMWALTEGVVAIALLLGGGLKAMQTASVTSGVLFILLLFVMCFSLLKSLRRDTKHRNQRLKG